MNKTLKQTGLALALVAVTGVAIAAPSRHESRRDNQRSSMVQSRHADNTRQWQHQPRVVVHQQRSTWQRGQQFHGSYTVVNNYGHYGLRQPPRGYHWVRANNQYLLVAMATQLIVNAINH